MLRQLALEQHLCTAAASNLKVETQIRCSDFRFLEEGFTTNGLPFI